MASARGQGRSTGELLLKRGASGSRRSFSCVTLQAAYSTAPINTRASPNAAFCASASVVSVITKSSRDPRHSAAPMQCSTLYCAFRTNQDLRRDTTPQSPYMWHQASRDKLFRTPSCSVCVWATHERETPGTSLTQHSCITAPRTVPWARIRTWNRHGISDLAFQRRHQAV